MRQHVSLPVGVAFLVMAVAGCSDANDHDASESPSPSEATPTTSQVTDSTRPTPSTPGPVILWPAPPGPLKLTVAAGLKPEDREFLTYHVHAHLDVYVDGKLIVVPSGIGINIHDPAVHRSPESDGSTSYGGIVRCAKPCISPLHTHDTTGTLHTESATPEPNTLGQFFIEWGVRLSSSCVGEYCSPTPVAFYVNGKPYKRDPRGIKLTNNELIEVVIGIPPPHIS